MISKARLDALTDGVFAVAMTLLVLDLRLPDSFEPKDGSELLHRLFEVAHPAIIYALSFYVLALRWVSMVRIAPRGESVSDEYIKWAMLHLLLVTFVPFTTMTVGRYATLAPAAWLYAGNTILFALVSLRMMTLVDHTHDLAVMIEHRLGLFMLIAASVLAIVMSVIVPKWAMLAYLVNLLDGPLRMFLRRRERKH